MSQPFRTTRRVEFSHTDAAGLAHFSAFFRYMEEAEHEFLRARGLSVLTHDAEGALSWPRVSAHCDYEGAVKFEDVLDIELRLERLGKKSVTYAFTFTHGGRPIATARMTSVCCRLDMHGPPQSIPIPDDIRSKIGQL
jgi:acyl-CoA thioester hydrolase